MLRADTQNLSLGTRARLLVKFLMYPGTNWISRDKSRVVGMFSQGSPERPIRTLDCGCGNAYFAYQAVRRHSRCVGITIHEWERIHCQQMRSFLGLTEDQLELRHASLETLAADPGEHGRYDQVLLLDVLEHILDDRRALRQVHAVTAADGLVYITTPNRDWQGNADHLRVTRTENGWHVRNGYTFEQLETLLRETGFEPVDRLRFGGLGTRVVTWIQHHVFRSWIDPLTVLAFPGLWLVSVLLAPWRDPHTIFVLARKSRVAE
ncbi:MAG TPA: methyltransferase domain-containing protein [Isosphaeraceae bacterium]|nr:methyltransferase domain-containing protein [Isosphaeraceae bacterium]